MRALTICAQRSAAFALIDRFVALLERHSGLSCAHSNVAAMKMEGFDAGFVLGALVTCARVALELRDSRLLQCVSSRMLPPKLRE